MENNIFCEAMMDPTSLQQRITELERLNNLSQVLSSTLDVNTILQEIVKATTILCKADKTSILLFDPSTKETVKTLVHQSNSSESSIEHTVNLIVAGWVLENRKPFLTNNLVDGLKLPNPPDRYRKYGSTLAVPLMIEGEIIGIINLINNPGSSIFDNNSLRIALNIAQQSAKFIYNAKLHEKMFEENIRLRKELYDQYNVHGIIGISKKMKAILDLIPKIAKSNTTVIIYGETGTGKELIARAIHFQSDRAHKPFIPINCAAIPANLIESELFGHERGAFTGATSTMMGKFELANSGTIFLDEISEMPSELQPKLLRVLEERKFFRLGSSVERNINVRVISASNRNLDELVREGKFREDLFYRLNVMPIFLPPLRERKEDIPILAQHFLNELSHKSKNFSKSALDFLQSYEWKGNVRELKNIVERISLLTTDNEITSEHIQLLGINTANVTADSSQLLTIFQTLIKPEGSDKNILEEIERIMVELAIKKANGNISQAARLLGIDRKAMDRRREKFKI